MRRTALLAAVALIGPSVAITPTAAAQAPPAVPNQVTSDVNGTVTLITGDKVTLTAGLPPQVEPGAGRDSVPYRISKERGTLRVLPVDAARAVAAGALDPRLFEVTTLLRFGYDDSRALPLIVQRDSKARAAPLAGLKVGRQLASVGGYSAQVAKRDTAGFWRSLFPARNRMTGAAKVWLNGLRKPLLDKSVPQIGAPTAWTRGFTGRGVTVAVIDTGIDSTHPDLAGQVSAARTFIDGPAGDQVGHGTHVASTIAGKGATYRGVAPDAKLVDAKVCTEEDCPEDAILAAMDWAAKDQRVAVVNMSLGGPDGPEIDPIEQAVNQLSETTGTLFVISAGNGGRSGSGSIGSPGSAEAALTVGAVDQEDKLAEFSSRGPRVGDGGVKPDLTAPGVEIAAARAAGTQLGDPVGEHHVRLSGTSMAAPHAAGAAALLRQQHPGWTGAEVKSALMASAKPGTDPAFDSGAGRLAVDVAIDQRVTANPNSVGFGLAKFPHHDDEVLSRTITYRNTGDQPVELDLELQLPNQPAHPFKVSQSKLSVPAGGSAAVVLTADTRPESVPNGLFSGRLVATGPGVRVSTPLGIEKEDERYDVTLTHLGRDGGDPAEFITFLDRLGDCDDAGASCFASAGGSSSGPTTLRVPPGDYSLGSFLHSADRSWTLLVNPILRVTGDTTVRPLDARTAGAMELSVPRATAGLVVAYLAVARHLRREGDALSYVNTGGADDKLFVGDGGAPAGPPDEVVSMALAIFAEPGPAGDFRNSPYSYKLQQYQPGKVMNGIRLRPAAGDFAEVRMNYASDAADPATRRVEVGSFAVPVAPLPFEVLLGPGGKRFFRTPVPFKHTEFVLAGELRWMHWTVQYVPSSQDGFVHHQTVEPVRYRPGQVTRHDWNKGVLAPRLVPVEYGPYGLTRGAARRDDTIELDLGLRADSDPNHVSGRKAAVGSYRLFRDGELVVDQPQAFLLEVPVPAAEAEYRLESRVTDESMAVSSRIDTTWTFRSGHSEGVTALPLMVLRFAPRLDDRNRARAGLFAIPVTVQRQPGAAAATPRKPTVEYSSDQGRTWRAATVVRSGSGWKALVVNPAGTKISLRGGTSDSAGNSVQQLVQDAYLVE